MPGVVVDGQDVDVVNAAVSEALERARGGGGPSLLEMKTYRYRGHSRSDPAKYRAEGELERWKHARPHRHPRRQARRGGRAVGRGTGRVVRTTIQVDIDAAAERAAQSPDPTLEETRQYVYAD